ncbi:MAG: PorP/SprF family type IX secretion system membrane protein [Bacteroidetes bacterium]|nr:PorP/SprF family type IX secretion system membrane protein [Bacteroidota bacterium]
MKRKLVFLFITINFPVVLFSQDTYFSQYNSFPLQLDKSLAGSAGCSRALAGTRLQWLNFDGGYITRYFSYDQYSRHICGGLGLDYSHSDESNGVIKNDFVYLTYSPSISIGKRDSSDSLRPVVIKPAFNGGYVRHWFDYSQLTFGDEIDPYYGFIYGTRETQNQYIVNALDFGAGLSVYGKTFVAGFYAHHITQPDLAFVYGNGPLYMRKVFHASYLLKCKWLGKFTLVPSCVYEAQGNVRRTELSLSAKYDKYILGISRRFASSVVFMAGVEYKFLKVGYAYDLNTTPISKIVGATHEILLCSRFACREKKKRIRTLKFFGM